MPGLDFPSVEGSRAYRLPRGRLCVRGAPSSPSLRPFPIRGLGLSRAAPGRHVKTTALHGWGCGHAGGLGSGIPATVGPVSPKAGIASAVSESWGSWVVAKVAEGSYSWWEAAAAAACWVKLMAALTPSRGQVRTVSDRPVPRRGGPLIIHISQLNRQRQGSSRRPKPLSSKCCEDLSNFRSHPGDGPGSWAPLLPSGARRGPQGGWTDSPRLPHCPGLGSLWHHGRPCEMLAGLVLNRLPSPVPTRSDSPLEFQTFRFPRRPTVLSALGLE